MPQDFNHAASILLSPHSRHNFASPLHHDVLKRSTITAASNSSNNCSTPKRLSSSSSTLSCQTAGAVSSFKLENFKRLHLNTGMGSLLGNALKEVVHHNQSLSAPPGAGSFCRAINMETASSKAATTASSSLSYKRNPPISPMIDDPFFPDFPSPRLVLKRQRTFDDAADLAPRCELMVPGSKDYPERNLLRHLTSEIQDGLRVGLEPEIIEMSCGGSYFMRNKIGRIAGVFKPCDEEPFAPHNPRDYRGGSHLGMKNGIPSGEGGIREAASFIIDDGYSRVPPTVICKVVSQKFGNVEKEGSLQQYVRHLGSSDDFGPSLFNGDDAQRIMLLDLRILNQDRHAGNILVTSNDGASGVFGELTPLSPLERSDTDPSSIPCRNKLFHHHSNSSNCDLPNGPPPALRRCNSVGPALDTVTIRPQRHNQRLSHLSGLGAQRAMAKGSPGSEGLRLIPIDHGFALPHPLMIDETEYCWLHWPQAKQPFSKELQEYITTLDVEEDIARLKSTLGTIFPTHCYLTLRIGTELLKQGVAAGLTPYEIALMVVRESPDRASKLEVLIEETYKTMVDENNRLKKQLAAEQERERGGASPMNPRPFPTTATYLLSSEKRHESFMAILHPKLVSMCRIMKERRILRSVSS